MVRRMEIERCLLRTINEHYDVLLASMGYIKRHRPFQNIKNI
jgi:hypothetical protein